MTEYISAVENIENSVYGSYEPHSRLVKVRTHEQFTVWKNWRWWFSWLSMIKNMAAAMFLIIFSQENHHRQFFHTVNIARVYGPQP